METDPTMKAHNRIEVPEDKLRKLYLEDGLSTTRIAEIFGCSRTPIMRSLREYEIEVRPSGFQKGNTLGRIHKGRVVTEEQRRQISETLKRRYKDPEFKKTHGFQPGRKQLNTGRTWFKKGAEPWNKGKTDVYSEGTLRKIKEARKNQTIPTAHTLPEKRFIELCRKYHLPFRYVGDGSRWIGSYNPDFVEENGRKLVVEIFGEYWHNPLRYLGLRWDQTEIGRKPILSTVGIV